MKRMYDESEIVALIQQYAGGKRYLHQLRLYDGSDTYDPASGVICFINNENRNDYTWDDIKGKESIWGCVVKNNFLEHYDGVVLNYAGPMGNYGHVPATVWYSGNGQVDTASNNITTITIHSQYCTEI